MKYYKQLNKFIHILILFFTWQVCFLLVNDDFLLPSPVDAVLALHNKFFEIYFWKSLLSSFSNLILAFLTGMFLLIFICFLCMLSQVKFFFKTLTNIFGSLPSFAIMPALLIIFGITYKTMLALLVYSMLWINLSYTITALEQVINKWGPHVKNLKIKNFSKFINVITPAMLPYFLVSAKNSWILCWRTLLAIEVMFGNLSSGAGIGVMMNMDRVDFRSADIWGMIILIAIVGYFISCIFEILINKIVWFRDGKQ
jgi:NitT/TauT family transport system permease protein